MTTYLEKPGHPRPVLTSEISWLTTTAGLQQTWVRLNFLFESTKESFDSTQVMTYNGFTRIDSNDPMTRNGILAFDSN